jgi:hypothetical protein
MPVAAGFSLTLVHARIVGLKPDLQDDSLAKLAKPATKSQRFKFPDLSCSDRSIRFSPLGDLCVLARVIIFFRHGLSG